MTWEESLTSFWITFFFMIIGVVLLYLPTTLLLHWAFRTLVWAYLGPWNRIYSELFYKNGGKLVSLYSDSEDDRRKHNKNVLSDIVKNFEEKGRIARIQGEETEKMKAMRAILNGRYISRIPATNRTRFYDYPRASKSQAAMMVLSECQDLPPLHYEKRRHVPSQRLYGKMIPTTIEL